MNRSNRHRPAGRRPIRRWPDSVLVQLLTERLGPPRDFAAYRAWGCAVCRADGWPLLIDLQSDPDQARCYSCQVAYDADAVRNLPAGHFDAA